MTAARVATDQLTLALLSLAEQGLRTHCSDPTSHHLWLSEHDGERRLAALMCSGCPILQPCTEVIGINASACGLDAIEP